MFIGPSRRHRGPSPSPVTPVSSPELELICCWQDFKGTDDNEEEWSLSLPPSLCNHLELSAYEIPLLSCSPPAENPICVVVVMECFIILLSVPGLCEGRTQANPRRRPKTNTKQFDKHLIALTPLPLHPPLSFYRIIITISFHRIPFSLYGDTQNNTIFNSEPSLSYNHTEGGQPAAIYGYCPSGCMA